VSELEYIAALHQTCPLLRKDATISSLDIVRFLKSRCGLCVPDEEGIRIVRGLGGGGGRSIGGITWYANEEHECVESSNVVDANKKGKPSLPLVNSLRSLRRRLRFCRGKGKTSYHEKVGVNFLNDTCSEKVTRFCQQDESRQTTTAKVLVHFGGSLSDVGGSIIRRLSSNEEESASERGQDTSNQALDSPKAKVLAHFGGSITSGTLHRLSSSSDSEQNESEHGHDPLLLLGLEGLNNGTLHGETELDNARGGTNVETEEYLDLVQIAAILLMPTLASAAKEWMRAQNVEQNIMCNYGSTTMVPAEEQTDATRDSLLDRNTTLFADVLSCMLTSIESSRKPFPTLDAKLVQDLLMAHGEYDRAADEALVEQMVEAAQSSTFLFDVEALVNALTLDLKEWDIMNDINYATALDDVWGDCGKRNIMTIGVKDSSSKSQRRQEESRRQELLAGDESEDEKEVEDHIYPDQLHLDLSRHSHASDVTLDHGEDDNNDEEREIRLDLPVSAVDASVDQYSSMLLTVAIFTLFVCISVSFVPLFRLIPTQQLPLVGETFRWILAAALLMLIGTVVIVPLSIGNNPARRSSLRILAILVLALDITWTSYFSAYRDPLWLSLLAGNVCVVLILIQFVSAVIGDSRIRNSRLFTSWFGTSDAIGSGRAKRAATHKMCTLLENARKLHDSSKTRQKTMTNFVRNGESYEDCGGLGWTWRRIRSGSLFDEEGIWIMSRLYIIQTVQVACIAIMIHTGLGVIARAVDAAQAWHATMSPDQPDWIYAVVPTPKQVKLALYPALGLAFVDMIAVLLVYMPR